MLTFFNDATRLMLLSSCQFLLSEGASSPRPIVLSRYHWYYEFPFSSKSNFVQTWIRQPAHTLFPHIENPHLSLFAVIVIDSLVLIVSVITFVILSP